MAIKCPKCQTDNPETQKFCGECAAPLMSSKAIDITETIEAPKDELATGVTFADRYQIIEELGKGGMGKVYKVHDTEIREKVALKLLKPEIAADTKTIDRFRNEIKLARKIAHRNVCKMYDLGEEKGTRYIAMEYIDGEDLKSMIRMMGPLSMGKAVSIAKQVCAGLGEAHRLGIVHRDLKPSNIMIDKFGNAKIMDFGIARSLQAKGITGTGVMIGTPEYMSPEQVDGKDIDQRTDIYSLGIILYEMVTGQTPFDGETAFSVAMKHKSEKPKSPVELNNQIGIDLENLILKCMEKDKEFRYQNTEELITELTLIEQEMPTTEKAAPKKKPITSRELTVKFNLKKLLIPVLVVISLAILTSISVIVIKRLLHKKPVSPSYKQLTFKGNAATPAISPDGKFIAYVDYRDTDEKKLMIQDLLSGQSLKVFSADYVDNIRWTPDGSEITAWVKQDSVYKTLNISRLGGTPREFELSQFFSWSPDGSQLAHVFMGRKKVEIVNKSTGQLFSFSIEGPVKFFYDIDWSPTGKHLLILTQIENARYVIWTMRTDGSDQHNVIEESGFLSSPRWSSKGDAVYCLYGKTRFNYNELWKIPVSPESGKPIKAPYIILSGLNAFFDISLSSDNKYLAYTRRIEYSNLLLAEIKGAGTNRRVETKQLTTGTLLHEKPNISPDRTQIAFAKGDGQTSNIYVMPIDDGRTTQLTFFNSRNTNPVWSPDGKWIAFGSNEGGTYNVWKVSPEGGRPYQFAKTALSDACNIIWNPETFILYHKEGNRNFIILNPETEEEKPLVKDEFVGWIFDPAYSPDGKKIAVNWNRKPKRGIWIISLEDFSSELLFEGFGRPIGWSTDGNWVNAYDREKRSYLRIELGSGQAKELPVIPFTIEGKTFYKIPDEKPEVFVHSMALADIWLVENFDPEIKSLIPLEGR